MDILLLLIFFAFIVFVISLVLRSPKILHAHWNTLIDDYRTPTQDFYQKLKEELSSHGIENLEIQEVSIATGNVLSSKRLYLRVSWNAYTYDCCCAPFGNGTFFSWWLYSEKKDLELLVYKIPFVGNTLSSMFFPVTYYTRDTASMFMTYVQASVLKVVDGQTKAEGIRPLSELERKPMVHDLFKR